MNPFSKTIKKKTFLQGPFWGLAGRCGPALRLKGLGLGSPLFLTLEQLLEHRHSLLIAICEPSRRSPDPFVACSLPEEQRQRDNAFSRQLYRIRSKVSKPSSNNRRAHGACVAPRL